jgi:hypothetical protein
MQINLPPAPFGYVQQSWALILDTIRKSFVGVVSQNEAAYRILLRSPNGTVYEVTVSDTGTLQTAVNDGKTRI